jgi:hypothetical protein
MAEEITDPRWRQLCELALLEMDPEKLLEKVAAARSAILDRIEDSFGPTNKEQTALHDALGTLSRLQQVAMSKIQTGTSKAPVRRITT